MSILIDRDTPIVVQGATGLGGRRALRTLNEFGHPAAAGVTPGKGGTEAEGVPVFDTVAEAVAETGARASLLQIPPQIAPAAALEAVEAGIETIAIIAEGIPVHEALALVELARDAGSNVIGPNCIGAITPGEALLGMVAPGYTTPGRVGVLSRSGTLCLESLRLLSAGGVGQSTAVSIGGDPIVGTSQAEYLEMFEADPETDAVLLLGEVGGTMEQAAAERVAEMRTPVVAFVAGSTALPGRRMGHLGALSVSGASRATDKREALAAAGATVVPTLWDARDALREAIDG